MAGNDIVHVIDDDTDVRQSLAFLLSTAGLAVRVHDSASAFLKILSEIQDGSFARRWIEEGKRGNPEFRRLRAENANARIETVGAELRSHMAFLDPKSAPAGWADGGEKAEAIPGEGVA